MRTFEIDQAAYWKNPFRAILSRDRLSKFVVLDVEPVDNNLNDSRAAVKQKFKFGRIEVARDVDFGVNETTFSLNTHLLEHIDYNDTVMGYDLEQATCTEFDDLSNFPEVVIVRKFKEKRLKRKWKLK